MNQPIRFAAVLAAVLVAALPAAARSAPVEVEFINPDKFTDVGRRYAFAERDGVLQSLERHLVKYAGRKLAPGETLRIAVLDVDLAGSFEPWQRASSEVRIVRDVYPPRIDLRFRLARADGTLLKEGERTLRDAGFLLSASRYSSDTLQFEKALLDQWLQREFNLVEKH